MQRRVWKLAGMQHYAHFREVSAENVHILFYEVSPGANQRRVLPLAKNCAKFYLQTPRWGENDLLGPRKKQVRQYGDELQQHEYRLQRQTRSASAL